MTDRIRLVVLFGGRSAEHTVSEPAGRANKCGSVVFAAKRRDIRVLR